MDSRLGLKEGGALHPLRPDQIPFPTTFNIPDQTLFFSDRPTAKGLGGQLFPPPLRSRHVRFPSRILIRKHTTLVFPLSAFEIQIAAADAFLKKKGE